MIDTMVDTVVDLMVDTTVATTMVDTMINTTVDTMVDTKLDTMIDTMVMTTLSTSPKHRLREKNAKLHPPVGNSMAYCRYKNKWYGQKKMVGIPTILWLISGSSSVAMVEDSPPRGQPEILRPKRGTV